MTTDPEDIVDRLTAAVVWEGGDQPLTRRVVAEMDCPSCEVDAGAYCLSDGVVGSEGDQLRDTHGWRITDWAMSETAKMLDEGDDSEKTPVKAALDG